MTTRKNAPSASSRKARPPPSGKSSGTESANEVPVAITVAPSTSPAPAPTTAPSATSHRPIDFRPPIIAAKAPNP